MAFVKISFALLLLVSLTAPVLAQPALTPPIPTTSPPAEEPKNPSVAVALSVGVTSAGAVALMASDDHTISMLGVGALFLGPSTGRWYAGELGGLGIAARVLGVVGAGEGLSQLLQSECDDEPGEDCSGARRHGQIGVLLMVGGAGLFVASSIADVIFAKQAVDHWNERHALTVTPTALSASGRQIPGLAVGGTF